MRYSFREDFEKYVSRREVVRQALAQEWTPDDGNPYDFLDWATADDEDERVKIFQAIRGLPHELLETWCAERAGHADDTTERLAAALVLYYTADEDELEEDEPVDEWWRAEHAIVTGENKTPAKGAKRKRRGTK